MHMWEKEIVLVNKFKITALHTLLLQKNASPKGRQGKRHVTHWVLPTNYMSFLRQKTRGQSQILEFFHLKRLLNLILWIEDER